MEWFTKFKRKSALFYLTAPWGLARAAFKGARGPVKENIGSNDPFLGGSFGPVTAARLHASKVEKIPECKHCLGNTYVFQIVILYI